MPARKDIEKEDSNSNFQLWSTTKVGLESNLFFHVIAHPILTVKLCRIERKFLAIRWQNLTPVRVHPKCLDAAYIIKIDFLVFEQKLDFLKHTLFTLLAQSRCYTVTLWSIFNDSRYNYYCFRGVKKIDGNSFQLWHGMFMSENIVTLYKLFTTTMAFQGHNFIMLWRPLFFYSPSRTGLESIPFCLQIITFLNALFSDFL